MSGRVGPSWAAALCKGVRFWQGPRSRSCSSRKCRVESGSPQLCPPDTPSTPRRHSCSRGSVSQQSFSTFPTTWNKTYQDTGGTNIKLLKYKYESEYFSIEKKMECFASSRPLANCSRCFKIFLCTRFGSIHDTGFTIQLYLILRIDWMKTNDGWKDLLIF